MVALNKEAGTDAAEPSESAQTADPGQEAFIEVVMPSLVEESFMTAGAVVTSEGTTSEGEEKTEEEETSNKLQELIDKTMKAVEGQLSGRLQIILNKNTTYEGDVSISKNSFDIADDFELELAAEDAGDSGLDADGTIKLAGGLVIKGISVILKGLGISGKVSVQDAKLQFYGSGADDTLDLELSTGSTGAVKTGDGADTVSVVVGKGGSADIATGDGADVVNITNNYSGTAVVDSGDDNDKVNVDARGGDTKVFTRAGDDEVTVLAKSTTVNYENAPLGTVDVDLGEGMDEATVNLSVADAVRKVAIKGGDDSDHLHLTGTLSSTAGDARATGTEADMNLVASNGKTLNITTEDVENVTDSLSSKNTVYLTPAESGVIQKYIAKVPFTNYVINTPASTLKSITVTTEDGKPLALSSLLILTPTDTDGENKLIIREGTVIDVRGLNLVVRARNIEVNGTLKADTVQLEALDGTGMYARTFDDQYAAYEGLIPVPGLNEAGSALTAAADLAWDLVNVEDEATIVIGEKAAVYSSGDVIMLAKVEQSGSLISLIPVNVVNVKVAHASIDIAGKVYAGYDFDKKEVRSDRGSVRADAQIKTTMGYDDGGHMTDGFPLAVSVAYANAEIHVADKAVIQAAKDISLKAGSELKAATRSDSGVGGAPAAIAVAVLVNDVHTTVNGTLEAKSGDVTVSAEGNVDARTLADKGSGQSGLSGGYVAVSVVLQDVQAKLSNTAVVNAAGDVKVISNAVEKVENRATSSSVSSEEKENAVVSAVKDKALSLLKEKVWPWVKGKFTSETAQEKLDKAMKKIVTSNHSVQLDDDAQKKGEVTVKINDSQTTDSTIVGNVEVKPWAGYKVKSITWRGYNPGDSTYTTGKITTANGAFIFKVPNVTIFVEYEEDEDYDDTGAADLFADKEEDNDEVDIQKMLDDINNDSENDDEELDKSIQDVDDEDNLLKLTLTGSGGALLTYETDPDNPAKSISRLVPGQQVRLVPNPGEGRKLKEGSLKVTYKVKETDKETGKEKLVTKSIVVNADSKGRYIFTVPEDADKESGITASATFEYGVSDNKADETKTQAVGAVAVVVASNDNQALIDTGAAVTAGGAGLQADAVTDVDNKADGSPVAKAGSSSGGGIAGDGILRVPIQRRESKTYEGYDAVDRQYGLVVDAMENGAVTSEKDADGRNYTYSFSAKGEEGYNVVSALLTCYSNGSARSIPLKPGADGKYHIDLTGVTDEKGEQVVVDQGSTARLSFVFAKEGEYGVVHSRQDSQTLIANPIRITYNALKSEDDNVAEKGSTGAVVYAGTVEKNGRTQYRFAATASTSKGYVMDGGLGASWSDGGSTQTRELTQEGNYWYLDPEGIPAGVTITVSGSFKDDFHDFKVDSDSTKNGKVVLADTQVKKSDEPRIVVKPDAGYSLKDIVVTYTDNGSRKTIKLSDTDSKLKQVKDKDGKPVEGAYTFTVPGIDAGTKVDVSASFQLKTIGLYAGENDADKDYTLSEKNVASGDKVTATLSENKVQAGYKLTKIIVTDANGKTVAESSDGSFTVPKDTAENAKLTVKVEMALKEIAIEPMTLTGGSVKPNVPRADRGERVTVTVTPDKDFKVKSGTLKAVIRANDGSYTEEVFMGRQNDTTYAFDMPADIEDPSAVTITFVGEFEPGQSDSSAFETSLGAGIAVSVVNSESRSDLRGRVTADGSVAVGASITGGVKTESKAGYSKGNIGIGGAVSVQVASLDSKALIHNSADVRLDGKLSVDSSSEVSFAVNADASGSGEAKKTGVGAGIAVAVDGSDTFAAVQDGTKLTSKTAAKGIKGISITANQKLQDTVSAKAGAAGGTAVVPVAAVDVAGASAEAYMGRVSGDKLKVTGDVGISAASSAKHTLSADASASGKGAGVGAAIDVSVISDTANAALNQSLDADQVTVVSENTGSVSSTATASASGGKSEGKSADSQADGLMGGAAKLAGKNKSSGVSGGKIDQAMKGRQKSETSEGTVGVAGAVAVNVQTSEARSEIMDGVSIRADGLVAVTAKNGTTSKVKANASTTNSDVGVGVGAAVNIIELNNIARMGSGEIEAAMVKVAANTIMTEPETSEQKPAEVKSVDDLAKQLGEMVGGYINDLVKELGLDQYISEDLLGEIINPVVTNTTNELIKATGLSDLLGGGDLAAKYEKAQSMLLDAKDGLLALPEQLLEPFMTALDDAIELSSLTEEEIDAIKEVLLTELTAQMKLQFPAAKDKILNSVKDGMLKYLKDSGGSILSGVFSGNIKGKAKEVFKKAKDEIVKAVKNSVKSYVTEVVTQTLQTAKIPGVNAQNMDRVTRAWGALKDAYKKETLNGIFESAADHVTETFRKNVFDYEAMLAKIAQTDFKESIVTGLKNAAKTAAVTLTNETIGAISSHFDLALEAEEEKGTGHVIDTQAIAGAGAREVGVAGSVAIAVLNAETSARIADGGRIEVGGDLTVEADETRNVNNVASAAVDSKGRASANKSAAEDANKDVAAGENTVGNETVTLKLGAGAAGSIRQGDMADKQPKIYVTLNEGYRLPEGNKASFAYTDKSGVMVLGEVELKQENGQWILDTASGGLKSENIDLEKGIRLELKPEEILNKIHTPSTLTDGEVTLETGAVTVSVKDREAENGTITARQGETVQIRVARAEGRKVSAVGYSWKDADGKVHDVELNGSGTSGKEKAFTQVVSNGEEFIYTFSMPAGEVTDIVVAFEKGEDSEAGNSQTSAKDENGKSVGVGAAFSMVYGDTKINAEIGKRSGSGVTAGELTVKASSDHAEDIASAAGSDPLEDGTDMESTKDFSLDASVALNILDTAVLAGVNSGTSVKTTGYGAGEEAKDGDLRVSASENAVTETHSSSFAVGGSTAVGASVAINIASSAVNAQLAGGAAAAGSATIEANSHSEDTTRAVATAMGADIARTLNKVGETADNIEEKANGILDGSYVDKLGKKDDNKTANKVNSRLDEKKKSDGSSANGNASTSTNVLRTLGVKTQGEDAGKEGTDELESQIKDKTGIDISSTNEDESSKWQVAAAVGVTVADHTADTVVGKIVAGKDIHATAENTGNFNTMGTGASMSLAKHANSIAAGVAVSINDNKATVKASGDLISKNRGDIDITSKLTQNLDGDFAGKLAAQAISGSVAGEESTVSIAGAVSVVVSDAESSVEVAGGTASSGREISGGNIVVEATDKSKLAARAGGLSLSKGSSVGMGIASTNVISSNSITASVGDYAKITGSSFKLNAEKQAVTFDDYKNLIDMSYLLTDSSQLTDEQRKEAKTGLIDMHKGEGEDSYSVDVNLSSQKLLEAMDGLNFLSSQNTYVEAIAGSIATGSTKLSAAGSFAVAVTDNTVDANLGKNATVNLTRDEGGDGSMTVNAANGATTRIIAGSLSAAPAKASVGAVVSVLVDNDQVTARTGKDAAIRADGSFVQNAETTGDIQVFTAAMSAAVGMKAKAAVGGAVNVIVTKNTAESRLGSGAHIKAGGDASVTSRTAMDLMAISGSASVTAGAGVAAGGTVNVIYDRAKSFTTMEDGVKIEANNDLNVTSEMNDRMLSGTASLSVAAAIKNGKAGAGVANVIIGSSAAETTVGAGADLSAQKGNLRTTARNDAWLLNASVAAAGGAKTAVGLSFNVNVLSRDAKVNMKNGSLNAGKNIYAQASGTDTDIMAGLAVAGSAVGTAVGGNAVVAVKNNEITTDIADGVTAKAGENALLESAYNDYLVIAGGSIAGSLGGSAGGATAVTVVKNNEVAARLGKSVVTVAKTGNTAVKNLSGEKVNGVYVGANASETQFVGGAGVALAGGKGISANGVVLVSENIVEADAGKAKLESRATGWKVDKVYVTYNAVGSAYKYSSWFTIAKLQQYIERLKAGELNYVRYTLDGKTYTLTKNSNLDLANLKYDDEDSVTVGAKNDVSSIVLAGGVNFGASLGVGASAVVVSSNNEVTAKAHDLSAGGDVAVSADNHEDSLLLNVNAGGSGSTAVELGVTVADLSNKVNAIVGSAVQSRGGSFRLTADNTTDLTNIAVAVAGAGANAASPVFVYTGFGGETNAVLEDGTVQAAKDVTIKADSAKNIDQYTVGAAFAGQTALSGAVSIVSVKDQTNAQSLAGTSIKANAVSLEAGSDYNLVGASAAVAASGSTAAAVNGMVTIIKASTLAELGGDVTAAGGAANVNAHSARDVINAAATVSGSGQAGIGLTVMALVAGDKMNQDAADMLTYGGGDKKTFDASAMISALEKMGINTAPMKEKKDAKGNVTRTSLVEDLKGDGEHMNTQVGSNGSFDVASGYTSDGIYSGGGEKAKANETKDVESARKIGASARTQDPLDSVTARIAEGAKVDAKGVNVEAKQETLADLFGATVGVGGQVGGGLSFAMAQLRSNVVAASLADIQANSKDVKVNAISRSGEAVIEAGSDEEMRMTGAIKALGDKLNPTKRSIRAIGLAVGAGGVGAAAIAAGVVRTDNITSATLGGTVTDAAKVTVNSDHKYQDVLAATVGLAGSGEAAIAASIAGVGAYGTVTAKMDGGTVISGEKPAVSVTTDSIVNADTVALSAAISGGLSGAAGVSFVRNELTQHTSVDRGVTIKNTGSGNGGSLNVTGKSATTGNGLLMGLSGGAVGVGIGVGIVSVKPTLNTTVGVNGSGTTKLEKLDAVKVQNDASSKAAASILSVSAGAAGIGANVLLVFNDTNATAKAANVSGSMNSFAIDGQLDAAGSSDVLAVAAGAAAIGVNVNYVDVNSTNTAELNAKNFTADIADKLSVTAGDQSGKRTTSALTQSVTGTAGAVALGVNVSIARNRAVNDAIITGKDLNAPSVLLGSYGKGTAKADMTGVSVGAIKITASVIDALNETTNRARMDLSGKLNGSLKAESSVTGVTTAKMLTGGGSLVGIDTNVATAYGKTNAVTDIALGGISGSGRSVKVTADGRDTVTADIDNLIGLNAISVAAMVGAAHAQDVYSARVKLLQGESSLSDLSVTADSDVTAKSTVTPSSTGVNLAGASLGVNVSKATSTAYTGSELVLQGAKVVVDKDVDVKTTTSSRAEAIVKPAVFSLGLAIDVGVNKVTSDLKSTQAATLRLNSGEITRAGNVNVQSLVKAAESKATVSTSGADEKNKTRVKLGAVAVDSNIALAKESLASTAAVIGGAGSHLEEYQVEEGGEWVSTFTGTYKKVPAGVGRAADGKVVLLYEDVPIYETVWKPNMVTKTREVQDSLKAENNRITADNLNITAKNSPTSAKAYTQGAFQAGLLTVGNLEGQAYTGESINALFSGAVAVLGGEANLLAEGNASAEGTGTMPGALSLIGAGLSTMNAGVGSKQNRQTVKVLIGEGAKLNAGAIGIEAYNKGNAVSSIDKGISLSLASVGTSSQPTDSWYDTGVVIGDGAALAATSNRAKKKKGMIRISSESRDDATSTVSGASIGLGLNLNTMMGQNTIHDENNIDFGKNVQIQAAVSEGYGVGAIAVLAKTSSEAKAKTDMTGGGFIEGTDVKAKNIITRNARINIGANTSIRSDGYIDLAVYSGWGDAISTIARVETDGALALGNAEALTTLNSRSKMHVAPGVKIIGTDSVTPVVTGGSAGEVDKPGIETLAVVKAHGGGINPVAIAKTQLYISNYVDLNRRENGSTARDRVTISSKRGNVDVWAVNDCTHVVTNSNADGKAAGGRSLAKSVIDLNLRNLIWVDDANLQAPQGKVVLEASNGADRALIEAHPYGELYAVGGSVSSDLEWSGTSYNQIRTNNKSSVSVTGTFVHNIYNPSGMYGDGVIRFSLSQDIGRGFITSLNLSEVIGSPSAYARCDFCFSGGGGLLPTIDDITTALLSQDREYTGNPFEKALAPVNEIQRQTDSVVGITKARYGEEDDAAAGEIYVLDMASILGKDVVLSNEQIMRYRLWNNTETQQDVFLLPNATRLYGNTGRDGMVTLNFVTEVIRGDVRGDGGSYLIDIITALTDYAVGNPVIPIGSTGSLDFGTGELTLASRSDFELYLHEISAGWLTEKLEEGFIRMHAGSPEEINEAVENGTELPEGELVEGLTEGSEAEGWKQYWIGDSPETAEDHDQMLVSLLVNAETDEVDAFRTSISMLQRGEAPVDVSLYLYRDSRSDRMEEEKYNMMCFDTPEDEKSLVKVVTDVLAGRQMEMPRPLKIVLRGFDIGGADWPVYSLTDHFFALCDGTDGEVSMFEEFYRNTFDGDTFDSDYIRIEGIADGRLNVTVKEGQPVWPEWTDENRAEDIAGSEYVLVGGKWIPAEEVPESEEDKAS